MAIIFVKYIFNSVILLKSFILFPQNEPEKLQKPLSPNMKWIFQWVDLNYHFLYSCISHIFQIPIYRIKFPVFWPSVSSPLKRQGSDRRIEGSIFSLCCHFHWGPLNCIRLCLSPSLILSKREGTTSTSETGESLLSILLRQEYWVRVYLLEAVTRPRSLATVSRSRDRRQVTLQLVEFMTLSQTSFYQAPQSIH